MGCARRNVRGGQGCLAIVFAACALSMRRPARSFHRLHGAGWTGWPQRRGILAESGFRPAAAHPWQVARPNQGSLMRLMRTPAVPEHSSSVMPRNCDTGHCSLSSNSCQASMKRRFAPRCLCRRGRGQERTRFSVVTSVTDPPPLSSGLDTITDHRIGDAHMASAQVEQGNRMNGRPLLCRLRCVRQPCAQSNRHRWWQQRFLTTEEERRTTVNTKSEVPRQQGHLQLRVHRRSPLFLRGEKAANHEAPAIADSPPAIPNSTGSRPDRASPDCPGRLKTSTSPCNSSEI